MYTRHKVKDIYELSIARSSHPLCSHALCFLIVSKIVGLLNVSSSSRRNSSHMLLTNAYQTTCGNRVYCHRQ